MIFHQTPIAGVLRIEPDRVCDERGFFARTFSERDFAGAGLVSRFVQCSISFNARKGTLRGMHYQAEPYAETKLVRCTAGAIYDVALDLRPGSPTFCRWAAVELSAENRRTLYIPAGVAHGFQTLCDGAEVFYQISAAYRAEAGRGVRWNDPAFSIEWPAAGERVMSERDRQYPDFRP